jgi:hypothetical protein
MRVIKEVIFLVRAHKMLGRTRASVSELDATFEEKRDVIIVRGKGPGEVSSYEIPRSQVMLRCEEHEEPAK